MNNTVQIPQIPWLPLNGEPFFGCIAVKKDGSIDLGETEFNGQPVPALHGSRLDAENEMTDSLLQMERVSGDEHINFEIVQVAWKGGETVDLYDETGTQLKVSGFRW